MNWAILSSTKKSSLISVLEKNGFKVSRNKSEVFAAKGEHLIVIDSFGEVTHKVDFTKVFSKINYEKNISGFPQQELKKLIKEEKKTNQFLFDTFLHVIHKLNWAQRFYAEVPLLEDQNIRIVEFYDESDNVYNFIFLQQEDSEYMFMTTKSNKEIYEIIENVLDVNIEDICPDLIDLCS